MKVLVSFLIFFMCSSYCLGMQSDQRALMSPELMRQVCLWRRQWQGDLQEIEVQSPTIREFHVECLQNVHPEEVSRFIEQDGFKAILPKRHKKK